MTTNYFTKWIEAVPTRNANDTMVIKFLTENIFSILGCPHKIIIDNSQDFKSWKMLYFCNNHNVIMSHSTAYYPQGNGLEKSSNKSLVRIIKKVLTENKQSWDSKLIYALWTNRVSTKIFIGTSPFQIVYGNDSIFPIHLAFPMMKFLQEDLE